MKFIMNNFGFNAKERRLLSRLNSPERIQRFLDDIGYHLINENEVCYSPRLVMRERQADCASGSIFAATALGFHGQRPLLMCLDAVRDEAHLLALFKRDRLWGAIGKSKYTGLRFRDLIYRNLRELSISYFESYFNYEGEKTLRGYFSPINLSRFDKTDWATSKQDISFIPNYFDNPRYSKRISLLSERTVRNLTKVTPLMQRAGQLWLTENGILEEAKEVFAY